MPDHDAVFIGLRQPELVPIEDGPRAMQCAAGSDGIGNFMFGQQLECFTRVIRDGRVLIQERAIEVKYNEFHFSNPCWGMKGQCGWPAASMHTNAGLSQACPSGQIGINR